MPNIQVRHRSRRPPANGSSGNMADFDWLRGDDDDGSEALLDFVEMTSALEAKIDDAKRMMKADSKKNIKVLLDINAIKDTGLHVMNLQEAMKWSPAEIRDRFTRMVGYFSDFDRERSELTQSKKTLSDGMIWGFWRKSYGDRCGLDEMTSFVVQDLQSHSDEEGVPRYGTRHSYGKEGGPTPVLEWDLHPFTQTGVTYYVGAATFAEIDAVSKVPSYPTSLDDVTWGERVLNPSDTDDQFQRPLDLLRMQEIQKFIGPSSNRILNSVILYIPPESVDTEDSSVSLSETQTEARLTIDIGKFLHRHSDGERWTYKEEFPYSDTRPLMLIDGQHRSRGGAISPEGKDKKVPIVILPPTYSLADAARTFTEINAGSEKLDKLLQLHLRHRFYLQSRLPIKDFSDWTKIDPAESRRESCRANRMAYDLAAKACSDQNSALRGRIRMMSGGRGGTNIAIKADVFHELASAWFKTDAPFHSEGIDLDEAYQVVESYFLAWKRVADHKDITGLEPWRLESGEVDTTNRWDPIPQKGTSGKPNSPYITQEMPFKAVMTSFPLVYELASQIKLDGVRHPSLCDFTHVLRPTQHIDWSQHKLIAKHYGKDKYTDKDLYNWISWALQDYAQNKVLYTVEDVWNPGNPDPSLCKPGRGFFSPASSELTQIHPPSALRLWPREGESIFFWSPIVPNTNRIVRWQISVDGLPNPEIKRSAPREGSLQEIVITKELHHAEEFTIAVFWERSASGRLSPPARQTLTFSRDEHSPSLVSIKDEKGTPIIQSNPPENIDYLESLDDDQYVIGADFGEGMLMIPPPPNSPRSHNKNSMAPARMRLLWCNDCFHGTDCTRQHCEVRDRNVPDA